MDTISIAFHDAPALDLSVRRFDIAEGLSRPFEVMIVAASRDPDIDFDHLIGKPTRVSIEGGARGARTWTGVCSYVHQLETGQDGGDPRTPGPDGLSLYAFRVVPRLWLLGQRTNHRVFSRLSAPAVARALLGEWRVPASFRLDDRRFPAREHRVEYAESDLAFLSRTLEEAGIGYFFEGGEGGTSLVLTDAPERGEPRSVPIPVLADPTHLSAGPHVAHARRATEVRPSAVEISDFDFLRPLYRASYQASSGVSGAAQLEQRTYEPGASVDGAARAEGTLLALGEGRRVQRFTTNLVDLAPGVVFSTAAAPEQRLCVVSTSLEGRARGGWSIAFEAAPCDAPIRPAQKTPRPRILGVESAVVVGPPNEEIHVDEHGRVRLRFHWDRHGAPDDERTPWVRVAEGWAGAGWGMINLPRVGQEVLVAFLDGDPDQPIVVGRAHDAASPPPEVLPAARTRSVLRSRSSPGSGGAHEIAFEDRRGHELVQIRSERDLDKLAQHDEVESAGLDRTATVGRHLSATVGGEDTVAVGEAHTASIAGGATRREISGKRIALTSGDATILLDGPDILVSGRAGVTIKAGGTVTIQGEPYVQINPPHAPESAAAAATQAPDHVVHFQVRSEGNPLAGARVHVQHEDGTTSGSLVTDANGTVRVPVDKPGAYRVKLGQPKSTTKDEKAETAKTTQPAAGPPTGGAPVTGGAAAPSPTASPAPIDVGSTPAQPRAKSTPTQHDAPITLEIVEPKPGTTFRITTKPAMPEIPLHARVTVQGEPVTTGAVRWELHASGNYRVRDASGESYVLQSYDLPAGNTRTTPGAPVHYTPAVPELIGGELLIKAIFDGGADLGGLSASKLIKGCQVLGEDPAASELEATIVSLTGPLAWVYLRLFAWESTLTQFARKGGNDNTPGWPLYGFPSGVGIVQRDPEATDWVWGRSRVTQPNNFFPRIFWDWRKNLAEGISSFTSTYIARGRADLDALRSEFPHLPPYPEAVLLRASIRRYNGGIEYVASGDGRHYLVSPYDTNNPGYVDDVFSVPQIDPHKYPIPAAALATEWP